MGLRHIFPWHTKRILIMSFFGIKITILFVLLCKYRMKSPDVMMSALVGGAWDAGKKFTK